MNYIKHLTGFFEKVSADYELNPTHISLYMAIFQLWNQNRFQNPISISRDELMRISKIASTATYHKCMKDLTDREYVIYKPSFNPFKGSILEVCKLDFYTKPVPKKELKKRSTKSKNDQVIEQVTKQALNKHQTSSKHVPYINNINNTNIINLAKQEISKNEKNSIFTNSIFDEVQESDLKIEKEKEKKLREKKKEEMDASEQAVNNHVVKNHFVIPGLHQTENHVITNPKLEEVQYYFTQQNYPDIEAQKFYNYFSSIGWLVGGRSPMQNWNAAAENWMLNANKFSKEPEKPLQRVNQLNATTSKNYAEPL